MLSLLSASELAALNIKAAQKRYKRQYDRHAALSKYQVGDLVLIRFPHEEIGNQRKLSRPWHGPYRTVEYRDPDLVVKKQFFPEGRYHTGTSVEGLSLSPIAYWILLVWWE